MRPDAGPTDAVVARGQGCPRSDAVNAPDADVISACMGAAVELQRSRLLIDALEGENAALNERLDTEKRATAILTELNETRKRETDALATVIAAKNETIAARDAVITTQDKLIDALKKKKPSPFRRIGDILLGAAAAIVLL